MSKKLTTEEFIAKAKLIHGDKYSYSQTKYVNAKIKVEIICSKHGSFYLTPNAHISGKVCCAKCRGYHMSTQEVIEIFKKVHGDKYDYSLFTFFKNTKKEKIICPIHGIFFQSSDAHKSGKGCSKCGREYIDTVRLLSQEYVIKRFINIHGYKYDYSKVKYIDAHHKIIIICPTHGEFKQRANAHRRGQGCSRCLESKGESIIETFLKGNNIDFNRQHKFIDCKNTRCLLFDFYIPKYNICIEFNGEQHYKPVSIFGGEKAFKLQQMNDKIKETYCIKNNIELIIIKHNESIQDKLKNLPNRISIIS